VGQKDRRVKADIKLHIELGDFVAWGKNSNPMGDLEPHYMVIIEGNHNYFSASSAKAKLGSKEAIALRNLAIADISEKQKINR